MTEITDDWYNHQISIVNKRNTHLEARVQQLEQRIGRLMEALEQIRQRTVPLTDESHLWKNAALLVDAGDIKRIADAALKESE